MTLVECIRQLVGDATRPKGERVLVVAPSTTATDVIVERLEGTEAAAPTSSDQPRRIVYVNWYQRDQASLGHTAQLDVRFAFRHHASDGFELPPAAMVAAADIVVCTTNAVSELLRVGVKPGFFRDIVIDETAQAMEPELLAVLRFASPTTNVIAAGDHKQLGAMLCSDEAAVHGLGTSWMERMLALSRYKDDTTGTLKVSLLRNFRLVNARGWHTMRH